jgi:hypothetical protein
VFWTCLGDSERLPKCVKNCATFLKITLKFTLFHQGQGEILGASSEKFQKKFFSRNFFFFLNKTKGCSHYLKKWLGVYKSVLGRFLRLLMCFTISTIVSKWVSTSRRVQVFVCSFIWCWFPDLACKTVCMGVFVEYFNLAQFFIIFVNKMCFELVLGIQKG